ncbi:unnamed protein product [Ectocarpus sp. 12 AP-2014]
MKNTNPQLTYNPDLTVKTIGCLLNPRGNRAHDTTTPLNQTYPSLSTLAGRAAGVGKGGHSSRLGASLAGSAPAHQFDAAAVVSTTLTPPLPPYQGQNLVVLDWRERVPTPPLPQAPSLPGSTS